MELPEGWSQLDATAHPAARPKHRQAKVVRQRVITDALIAPCFLGELSLPPSQESLCGRISRSSTFESTARVHCSLKNKQAAIHARVGLMFCAL